MSAWGEWIVTLWNCVVRLWNSSYVNELRKTIDELEGYDLHDILRQEKKVTWCEWHLNINENNNAIEIAKNFHKDFEKLQSSSSICHEINIIKETFLEFKTDNKVWEEIKKDFDEAYKEDDPKYIIRAYTQHTAFSSHINKHSAVNTNHTLELYCTSLNCPILAQTQEYIEAITKIFFHPKLNEKLVRKKTVYRGLGINDEIFIDNYKEGAIIITTTYLSTSANRTVARLFLESAPEDSVKVFCIYNINNTNRRTAIDVQELSKFREEEEILILRYVPFKIRSIHRMDNNREIEICFDECQEDPAVEENFGINQLVETLSALARRHILRRDMSQRRFVSMRNILSERF